MKKTWGHIFPRAICVLFFLFVCTSASPAAPGAAAPGFDGPLPLNQPDPENPAGSAPANLSQTGGQNLSGPAGQSAAPEPTADIAAMTAHPLPDVAVPVSTGFDFPVGGKLNHEGFEMNNCFSCDFLYYIGHTGEDYDDGHGGDPVYSASEGVVVFTGVGPGAWGNVIIVQHSVQGHPIYTQYAHLQVILVAPGQVVGRRQQIGIVGTTGTSAPHLHFEVKDRPIIGHGYTGYEFSGLTIYEWGINYWQPTWYVTTHRVLDSPFGYLDETRPVPGGFKLWGWAIDPNTASPIDVHIYIDGQATLAYANENRPDVGAAYPAYGPNHGYSASFAAAPGTHQACVYGINVGPGVNSLIECHTVVITGNPFGGLEDVRLDPSGQIKASGWTIDPDTADNINVKFYVNGQDAGLAAAADVRDDVGAIFPEYGGQHGFTAYLPKLPGDNQVCAYGVNTGNGADALLGCKTIRVGLENFPAAPSPSGQHYYWTYFDGLGANDWLLFANPASSSRNLGFDLNMQGRSLNLGLTGNPAIQPGQTLATSYAGIAGGPVVATSLTGDPAIVSQRILWAGNSLEEVPGMEEEKKSSHFYWPWYDMETPGYSDWVLVANPSPQDSVHVEISFRDRADGSLVLASSDLAPNAIWTPVFPGRMGGPVEMKAYLAGGAWPDDARDVVASQRVLSNYGRAFNEVPGISAGELADNYVWTWYDMRTPGFTNWVLIANPDPTNPVNYQLSVGGVPQPCPPGGCTIAGGAMVTPVFPGLMEGPVEVTASAPVISSQRVLAGPSFEEVPGYPAAALVSDYHWTWYDMKSPQSTNWILIANPADDSVNYQIRIGGADVPAALGGSGTIPPHGKVTPLFPGMMNGPVEVASSGGNVMVSQRVLWSGYFNEVLGTVLPGASWQPPSLNVSRASVYWASFSDYSAGQLSIDYAVGDAGIAAVQDVRITDAPSTNGVAAINLPLSLGNLDPGASAAGTVRYQIPPGTGSFKNSLALTVRDPFGNPRAYPLWSGGDVIVPPGP